MENSLVPIEKLIIATVIAIPNEYCNIFSVPKLSRAMWSTRNTNTHDRITEIKIFV
jgi:hypothetical protein